MSSKGARSNPSSGRLAARAESHGVAVLSAVQLAGLCRQHARAPLRLDDYRSLFATGGPVDTTLLDEQSEVAQRFVDLAVAVCRTLEERTPVFARLNARDLWLILGRDDVEEVTTEEEIRDLLHTLSSPLVRAMDGDPSNGYRPSSSRTTTLRRLRLLGDAITKGENVSP